MDTHRLRKDWKKALALVAGLLILAFAYQYFLGPGKVYGAKERAPVGNVEVLASHYEKMDSLNLILYNKKPKGVFVEVHTRITNTSKQTAHLDNLVFKMVDQDGNEFEHITYDFDDLELSPTFSSSASIMFDIPTDTSSMRLKAFHKSEPNKYVYIQL